MSMRCEDYNKKWQAQHMDDRWSQQQIQHMENQMRAAEAARSQRMGRHPNTGYMPETQSYSSGSWCAGRRNYDMEPALMDLDGRRSSPKQVQASKPANSNPMILKNKTPDIFRATPRSGTYQYPVQPVQVYYNEPKSPCQRMSEQNSSKGEKPPTTKHILDATNPDIFETLPRAGGYTSISPSHTGSEKHLVLEICKRCSTIYDEELKASPKKRPRSRYASSQVSMGPVSSKSVTREYRLRRAMDESDWETTDGDEPENAPVCSQRHMNLNMLAVTVTCVMMLASKIGNVEEYLDWVERYLCCIQDENCNTPRNIAGILREIQRRREDGQAEKEEADRRAAAGQEPPDGRDSAEDASQRARERSCRSTCMGVAPPSRKGREQCTTESSCTSTKSPCSAFRIPHPCPNIRMPRCHAKCGHMDTVDDFVPNTTNKGSQRGNDKHV